MASHEQKRVFLSAKAFAVAGASRDRSKFGNRVLRAYLSHGLKVYPVNPNESRIEGIDCLRRIEDLPLEVHSLSIVTPPPITERIVEAAIRRGIRNLWMQRGAESTAAIRTAQEAGLNLIADGSCILVELG